MIKKYCEKQFLKMLKDGSYYHSQVGFNSCSWVRTHAKSCVIPTVTVNFFSLQSVELVPFYALGGNVLLGKCDFMTKGIRVRKLQALLLFSIHVRILKDIRRIVYEILLWIQF